MRVPTVGLSMIVKDEAHVIARCLDSLRGLIDAAVIVDTGSTDGTQGVVRDYLARHGIAGEVIEEPWCDFAHNRTAALAALRRRADVDYALVMDADDSLAFEPGFDPARFKAGLDADIYDVAIHHGGTVYRRPQIFRNAEGFRYRSVLHEYLEGPPGDLQHAPAAGFHIVYGADGGRWRDPDKYRKDAALLERTLETETDPFLRARYTFYLAQSYRDSGQPRPAIEAYLRRADLGYWEQEVFESLVNAGKMMAEQGGSTDAVLDVLDRAAAAVPGRAEASHAAARICRERGENARGVAAAARAVALPQPEGGLFLQPWVYETGLLDEYAINAYWAGRDMDCLVACAIVLARPGLDAGTRDRIRSNRDFAYDRLKAQNSLWIGTLGEDRAPRVAVVTPYHRETPETLRRCLDSVKRQTVAADHILVADGHPQGWLDGAVARHIRNDRASGDAGDTPRAVGALLATSAGYTAICFLDADCWYEPDHVELCLRAALAMGMDACGIVTASRTIRRTDLTVLPITDEDSDAFTDTSCYFFLPRSFGLLPVWGLWPRKLSPVGDRLFFQVAASSDLPRARTRRATVNYVTTWAAHHRMVGEPPPLPLKENPDHGGLKAWIEALPEGGIDTLRRQLGVDVRGLYDDGYRSVRASFVSSSSRSDRDAADSLPVAGGRSFTGETTIVSFYTRDMPDDLIAAQADVVGLCVDRSVRFEQIRTDQTHGIAMDQAMSSVDSDVVVFLDIDCVPLHPKAIPRLVEAAKRDVLTGCVQRANHIANDAHLYVGPFCMAISKTLWNEIGRPSFAATSRGDVGEELTYRCEAMGKAIQFLWPSTVGVPCYLLRDEIQFGFNTEYAGDFLHAFGARHATNRPRFLDRCRSIAAELRAKGETGPAHSAGLDEAERLFAQGKVAQAQARLVTVGYDERTKVRYAEATCRIVRARRDFGPPSLVWRCDDRSLFEMDWIRELLEGVDYVDAADSDDDPKNAHLIVCDNRLTSEKQSFYQDRAARGSRIHLVHLSDEWASDDTTCYSVCASVFRNQWSPAHDHLKHVVTFPLGYKRGYRVRSDDRASAQRPLSWSFAGHTRSDARQAMLAALETTKPHRTHLTSGFDAADGLAQDDYRKLMEQTLFAPCPSGFSTPDTFRFVEALEAGCIPIVERGAECDYYRSWLGVHPALVIDGWDQAPDLMRRVLESGEAERLRLRCIAWWDATKKSYQELFATKIGERRTSSAVTSSALPRDGANGAPEPIVATVATGAADASRSTHPTPDRRPPSDVGSHAEEMDMFVTYSGLRGASDADQPHLGGNVTAGDPYTFCPSVWDYVIARFGVESVLDLGSGNGNASQFFFRKGLKTLAVDGLVSNIATSLYPTIIVDLTKHKAVSHVDLVHCQEVVEHIDEIYIDNLLDSLLSGRIILMTHALPGQVGHHHVNCRPTEYWLDHMARVGCDFLEGDTVRVRELGKRDGAPYMANTGLVFLNRARA